MNAWECLREIVRVSTLKIGELERGLEMSVGCVWPSASSQIWSACIIVQ